MVKHGVEGFGRHCASKGHSGAAEMFEINNVARERVARFFGKLRGQP